MTGSGDFQIARAPDTAASTEISGRKTGVPCLRNRDHGPVFLIFAMPAGAADAADDADGSGQRDNPWSLYRGHGESGRAPDFLHFFGRSRLPIELRWRAARLPYKFLIPMPH
jgi:hypothetical protein